MPTGGGIRGGPFHAGSPEGWFVGQPGLKVVCPGMVQDAYGLCGRRSTTPTLSSSSSTRGSTAGWWRPPAARRCSDPALHGGSRPGGPRRDRRHLRLRGRDRARGGGPSRRGRRGDRPPHRLAARPGGGAAIAREDLARPRPAGGSASTGAAPHILSLVSREAFELLDAPPALHAPPAAGAVRARARGRVPPFGRLDRDRARASPCLLSRASTSSPWTPGRESRCSGSSCCSGSSRNAGSRSTGRAASRGRSTTGEGRRRSRRPRGSRSGLTTSSVLSTESWRRTSPGA